VAYTPESLDIRKSPDVQLSFTPEVTLDQQARPVDGAAHSGQVFVRKISYARCVAHADIVHDLFRCGPPNAVDGSQGDFESLVVWNIYAGDDRHRPNSPVTRLALSRFEAGGLLVYHVDAALTANNFAARVFCLDRCLDFH
jgi:hypothetical protein